MRIGIDGIVLRGRDGGTLRYFEQLLTGLAQFDPINEYVVFANLTTWPADALLNQSSFVYQDVVPNRWVPPALRQQLYPSWHTLGKLDLLHSPGFVPPLLIHCKTITTIFDLTFELYPQTMKWTGCLWWRLFGRRGIAKADRIIALSESTKKDLERIFHVHPQKIRVVYPGTREIFAPVANPSQITTRYNLPERYILCVGTLERRKNIPNLVRAFALARQIGMIEHALVLVGARGWLYDDIFRTVEELGVQDKVVFLGYVPDEDLPALYSGAELFAYMSRYEGFGLPVLEAMACGTPVLTSNSSSLPEVAGDAGVLVPPDDVEQAAFQISRLLTDPAQRAQMAERGLQRARLFSMERFARQMLEVYDEVACGSV